MKLTSLLAAALLATPLSALAVTPVSYSFDQWTSSGLYTYHDSTGTKLTDGVLGYAGFGADDAVAWVGWGFTPVVNIDFDFGQVVRIGSVRVGSTQDSVNDVVLPSIDVSAWNGLGWTPVATLNVPESSANDHPDIGGDTGAHAWLVLAGLSIEARKLRVTARHSLNGPWTFIDEVQFTSGETGVQGITSVVPEPASWALMALGAAGLLARRRAAPAR